MGIQMEEPHLLLITFLCLTIPLPLHSLNSDGLSLLALKAAVTSDPTRVLSTWSDSDPTPCRWTGVHCSTIDHRVTSLSLSDRGLTGYIPSELGALVSLRRLSLSNNNFSKPIPANLFNATSLLYLDLSRNSLSGSVPSQIISLVNLTFLDLSSNLLIGSLPIGLTQLTDLRGTLNLSCNKFSGEVPPEYGHFPVMVSLDLRHNNLTGKIPQVGSLLNQGPTAFTGNPSLCGFPLSTPCPEAQNPNVLSTPRNPNPSDLGRGNSERDKSGSTPIPLPLISGVTLVIIAAVVFASLWAIRKKWRLSRGKLGKRKPEEREGMSEEEEEEGQKGKFVVMNEEEGFGFELEDLLRASAYVVGKSRSGIVYKVVVGGRGGSSVAAQTTVVAVRRLSEADDATWRLKDFEAEVEAIGRVQHSNIVRLRAYYYANDEKLLVSDFIRNGSLYAALHGGPSNDFTPLSWAVRLMIAQGTARGLAHIHECSPKKYVHGNIKSSKILLDENLQPHISGFGLNRLVPGASKPANICCSESSQSSNHSFFMGSKVLAVSSSSTTNAYLAPETRNGNKFTQKCDVYSFGILLMEMLTGRLPDVGPENGGMGLEPLVRKVFEEESPLSDIIDPALLHEIQAKKQVLAMCHIALSCTGIDPELRPRMRTVSENLDGAKFE
ncbi:hypothetical protein Dimus_001946 [Dionaea muscipula]